MPNEHLERESKPRTGQKVGLAIRQARVKLGLTLVATAERVGCAKSYLSAVENGHKGPPSEAMLVKLERVLGFDPGALTRLAAWSQTPPQVRRELVELSSRDQSVRKLAALIKENGIDETGRLRGSLDRAYHSGELHRLVEQVGGSGVAMHVEAALPMEVPLINCVTAGYPTDFTDLGYPARVADEYVRCPGLGDPDAFAARVVGDSMSPEYREGDIVVFSPARDIDDGCDCFVRLAPDSETTFKRIYFERRDDEQMIRLQPINNRYAPAVYPRERVEGLYRAVSVTRSVG
jgi:repressor LexA